METLPLPSPEELQLYSIQGLFEPRCIKIGNTSYTAHWNLCHEMPMRPKKVETDNCIVVFLNLLLCCHQLPSYATLTPTQSAKRGLLSQLEEGKDFALKQIATGVNAFASVLSDELDAFRKLSLQSEQDGVIDPSDDTQKEECEEEEEEEGEEEQYEDDQRGLQVEALGNGDLAEFSKIFDELDESAPLCSISLSEEVCAWKLPQQMCQSLFNQRNGSTACSLISPLIAYVLENKTFKFLTKD